MKNLEPAPVEVLEFQFASRYQTTQCLGYMGRSSCCIKSVQCFLGIYSVNTLYCYHQISAKHHPFGHWGEFPQCSLCGGFWNGGEVDQRLFGSSTTAPLENKLPKDFTVIKDTKDKLPGTSADLMHRKMNEVTFDIDKTQRTSCLALMQVLCTRKTHKVTFDIDSKK